MQIVQGPTVRKGQVDLFPAKTPEVVFLSSYILTLLMSDTSSYDSPIRLLRLILLQFNLPFLSYFLHPLIPHKYSFYACLQVIAKKCLLRQDLEYRRVAQHQKLPVRVTVHDAAHFT